MNLSKKILTSFAFLLISFSLSAQYVVKSYDLNKEGALALATQATLEAKKINKEVSIAMLVN
jgi:hypothetical protein